VAITSLTASLEGPAGAPVLVLGNSLGTSRSVWEPQVAAFRRHFRLLRYEHPGHGGSPAPAGPYTIGELGAAVLGLLDAHGIERARYCGISLGGMVGMWLAAHAPGRITALGLCCTSAFLPPASGWTGRAGQVRRHGMASIAEQSIGRWFTPRFRAREPAVPAAFAAALSATDPEGYAGCCEAIAAMDLRPALPSITAPTLVVAATEDPATPPAHGAAIASGIAGARLTVIRGAAHLANVSAPAQVSHALLGAILGPPRRSGPGPARVAG
jgi:3-oxoadipate enol-lactonase